MTALSCIFTRIIVIEHVGILYNFEQIITLPESGHDLRSARFYMLIIRGGAADLVGAVHFRQDQLQIDLFVFFSVFLAAFFLFVSVCVIIWQVG